jgi:ubiquinone/menaquinone biosynthesis C-methylase UbiE
MRRILVKLIDLVLSIPLAFEWQQRLCHNYKAIREEFKDYLGVSGKDILDIGCSTGTCAGAIVPMDRNRYVGVDIEDGYIRIASNRSTLGRFLVMDAKRLQFEDDRFDIVLFMAILHHMDDESIRECLKEVKRVLKNDGIVLVAEPVFTEGSFLSNLLLSLDRGRYLRSKDGYRKLFDGFKVIKEGYFRFSLHRSCAFVLRKV